MWIILIEDSLFEAKTVMVNTRQSLESVTTGFRDPPPAGFTLVSFEIAVSRLHDFDKARIDSNVLIMLSFESLQILKCLETREVLCFEFLNDRYCFVGHRARHFYRQFYDWRTHFLVPPEMNAETLSSSLTGMKTGKTKRQGTFWIYVLHLNGRLKETEAPLAQFLPPQQSPLSESSQPWSQGSTAVPMQIMPAQ
jgi:hypothetical protein